MALEIRRSTNVPSSGGSKKPTPSPAAGPPLGTGLLVIWLQLARWRQNGKG